MKKEGMVKGFVLAGIFSLVFSCVGIKQKDVEYFPMSDGARWEYHMEAVNNPEIQGEMVFLIDGEKTISGNKYYRGIKSYSNIDIPQNTSYYRKAKDGIYIVVDEREGLGEQLLLPLPPTTGKTWTGELPGGTIVHLRIDGKEIIVNDGIHAPILKEGKMELTKGNHHLVLKYNNVTGGGSVKLFWSPPGKNMEIIPEVNLRPR